MSHDSGTGRKRPEKSLQNKQFWAWFLRWPTAERRPRAGHSVTFSWSALPGQRGSVRR